MKPVRPLKVVALTALAVAAIAARPFDVSAFQKVSLTKSGTEYHRDGCRYLRKSKIEVELSEAEKVATPCSVCKAPK